jgi:beta-mannosidase
MKTQQALSSLEWQLSGWIPNSWRLSKAMEAGSSTVCDVPPIPAQVPGSVQETLRQAGIIEDWNLGLNSWKCEWVENRHWIYQTILPSRMITKGKTVRLRCLGLDYSGEILVNGVRVEEFEGSQTPYSFDLTKHLKDGDNELKIVFYCPPRWLGQFGYTSKMTEWKPRFNYWWDWTPRLVQLGFWDDITLETTDGNELSNVRCRTEVTNKGTVIIHGTASGADADTVYCTLSRNGRTIGECKVPAGKFSAGAQMSGLDVELWHPNLSGEQPLYDLTIVLKDKKGTILDTSKRRVGFKNVLWKQCKDSPKGADPWICSVNGKDIFLQGVNWTPIRPNFADVPDSEYRKRLELYKIMGVNVLRVWGGAYLEKECFYNICDELGFLVWQEFPLSSSGMDNWPPEDKQAIASMEAIVRSYIERRQHHASLLLWCGGNELQCSLDGSKTGGGKPVDVSHPMLAMMAKIVEELDKGRRFLATSSTGPLFMAEPENFGKGLHWDVHGPWQAPADLSEWEVYWQKDDALFRSETGSPGASSMQVIDRYKGNLQTFPTDGSNPLWARTSWWIEWPIFCKTEGRKPRDLEEYVSWSQARQAQSLRTAAEACKTRFPKCGGFIVWMGHDSFPCTANTSVVDYEGLAKPAAFALAEVFGGDMEKLKAWADSPSRALDAKPLGAGRAAK